MQKLLFVILGFASVSVSGAEFLLSDCSFESSKISFTPSAALTSLLRRDVKDAVVYRVAYSSGSIQAGPTDNLAVMDEVNNGVFNITYFEHDDIDGIIYNGIVTSVDLKAPTSAAAPLINFEASLNFETSSGEEEYTEGTCSLSII